MLDKILALCAEQGISLSELERRAGLKAKTVYRWGENRPSVDKVKKVADALGVTVDDLLAEDEE